jgi:L-aminopeptidase/D-esterase-like protein
MQTNNYLNVVGAGSGASAGASSGSSGGGGLGSWSALIEVGINFGVSYLTAKSEGRKNEAFLKKMAELDTAQAEKLKKIISESATENAKTKAIIDFLNEEDIKKLEAERKRKKTFLLIGLGFTVVLLGIVFYKLNKQNG